MPNPLKLLILLSLGLLTVTGCRTSQPQRMKKMYRRSGLEPVEMPVGAVDLSNRGTSTRS